MAITVRNIKNDKFYVFLGASYSFYKDTRASVLGGDLFPHMEQGEFKMVSVCNSQGDIEWFPAEELKVVDVDGVKVSEVLQKSPEKYVEETAIEECPACGARVYEDDRICGSCGLTLIIDEDNYPKF